jgi:hypothetical protein
MEGLSVPELKMAISLRCCELPVAGQKSGQARCGGHDFGRSTMRPAPHHEAAILIGDNLLAGA